MYVEHVEHTDIWLCCYLLFTEQIKALKKQNYVKHVEDIKACNFLNNCLICNLFALLELSYSPLFTQYISFILMLNMSDRVQKILLVFIQSNWMYVEHVKLIKAYNFLNNGPVYNPLALLELSYSPLFTQHISYILMSNMLNRVQKILLVFIDSNLMLSNMSDRHVSLYSRVHKI